MYEFYFSKKGKECPKLGKEFHHKFPQREDIIEQIAGLLGPRERANFEERWSSEVPGTQRLWYPKNVVPRRSTWRYLVWEKEASVWKTRHQ